MVHIGLESGQRVAKSKEHHSWFKESKRGREGHFTAVFRVEEDVVVFPMNIKFGEDFAILESIHQLGNEQEVVCIFDGVGV